MGTMPFHLEKGVMGLRFDYLTRSPQVRTFLLANLGPGADPFVVAENISVPNATGGFIQIKALTHTIQQFKAALQDLWNLDQTQFDAEERRQPHEYQADQIPLDTNNKDTGGNRLAFAGYWTLAVATNPYLKEEIRLAIVKALTNVGPYRPRIDYWWDCTLPDGSPPRVICSLDVPAVARVLFCTPHEGAVESHVRNELGPRAPFDEDGPAPG